MTTSRFFATDIYKAALDNPRELNADIVAMTKVLAKEDKVGRAWCKANSYQGYTSYASLDDLTSRATCFDQLTRALKPHAEAFLKTLQLDLGGRKLRLDNVWVNLLAPGGVHSGHIHPHCIVSGTYYVRVPDGASSIRFEDPRLPLMMASPLPRADADEDRRRFVHVAPQAGDLLMWESWLRHEVPINGAVSDRISVSFNYRWA